MFTAITHSSVFVADQDAALDFYVGKLGLEVADDVDLGFMRWLTVRVPGQEDRRILLEKPGPPSLDEATGAQVRELIAKGAWGLGLILTPADSPGPTRSSRPRASSSPRSRSSTSTGSTSACAT